MDDPDTAAAKAELRDEISAERRALTAVELNLARAAIRRHVLAAVAGGSVTGGSVVAGCVAAYQPLRTEPGSIELLAELCERGVRVLVPITLEDRDLDWRQWRPDGCGPPLGPDAIVAADLVVVPALAVDHSGTRLGRGGGSYDRALRRLPAGTPTVALLFDGEVRAELPADPWDVRVTGAVTPSGWVRLGGNPEFPSGR